MFFNIAVSSMRGQQISKRFEKFDVLMCHHQPGPWIGYCAQKKFFLKKGDLASIYNADSLLVCSRLVASMVKEIYGRSSAVCYPGVDTHDFRPLKDEETRFVVEKYRFRAPMLLSTGRHSPRKRLDWAILLPKRIALRYPNATLVITCCNLNLMSSNRVLSVKQWIFTFRLGRS